MCVCVLFNISIITKTFVFVCLFVNVQTISLIEIDFNYLKLIFKYSLHISAFTPEFIISDD